MANKKYVSLARLSDFLDNIRERYSQIGHKHKVSDLTDYTVDSQLSPTSTNPVQNKVIDAKFDAIADAMDTLDLAIDGKADAGHNHNDVYYTESEIDTKLSAKSDTTHNHDSAYDAKGTAETKANDALASAKSYTDTKVSGLASTTVVDNKISAHNTSTSAHNDIRELINGLTTRLNTLANSDDTTLDQMSEVVAYIKNNKTLIDGITTSKVNVADIINNLTTNVTNKPLSAAQGVAIKELIDALQEELDSHTHTVADITDLTATATELNYMDGVTSNVQTQLDAKAASTHTHSNVSLGQGYGDCYTASSTTEKVVDMYKYELVDGGVVSVKFIYSVPASATMNINGKGAKKIYYKGSAITADIIKGNDTATFIYDGSRYHLISVDRWHKDIVDLQATDGQVTQRVASANSNYPLLLAKNFQTEDYTGQVYFDSGVYLNPYYNRIYADISGTATGLSSTLDIAHGGTDATDVAGARTNLGLEDSIILKTVEAKLPSSDTWVKACYGNGKFVVVATSSDACIYSENGVNWEQAALPIYAVWRGVAYGNGVFVAIAHGSETSAYSVDGVTWSATTLPLSADWFDVAYGNGMFVATSSSMDAAYSTDGITWNHILLPISFGYNITYGNGKFVVVANSGNAGAYSYDGINWHTMTMPTSGSWNDVAYGNGKFVAIKENSASAAYSEDGIRWIETALPSTLDWNGLSYDSDNAIFIVVANDSDVAAYSYDGVNWMSTTMPMVGNWATTVYGNGRLVAMEFVGKDVALSNDGITWSTYGQVIQDANNNDVTAEIKEALGISDTYIKHESPIQIITWGADD